MKSTHTENMRTFFSYISFVGLTLLASSLLLCCAGQAEMSAADSNVFAFGVQAYRQGDYVAADRTFSELHRQIPKDVRVTYYLAITAAQQGRIRQAERLYREVIQCEPGGDIAALAREGLKYLPPEQALDRPPRFSSPSESDQKEKREADKEVRKDVALSNGADRGGASVNGNPAGYAPGGMSPQDWMMLQMMMSSGNGGNNPLGSMMPWMMTPSAPGGMSGSPTGAPAVDPEVMKTMLMNQLMQGFDLGGNKEERN